MSLPTIPISKIGTLFQSPSWRWQAVFSPNKFGLGQLRSKPEGNAGHLKRLIPKGIRPVTVYYQPIYLKQLKETLPSNLAKVLEKVWNKHFFKTNRSKITFNNIENEASGFLCWNLKKLKNLNDDFLIKIVLHCYNFEFNQYIADAIRFYKNENNDMTLKWIHYSIYGGKTDVELAKQWRKPVKLIEALRLMFFDYSAWPKDRVVQYSLIRQLVSNNEIDAPDYHVFRRIFDLGDTGLRSILGQQSLTEEEQDKVKSYLADAGVDVLMDQRYTISSTKDIMNYSKSVADYANIGLKRIEMEQRASLMRLTTKRMEKEMGLEDATQTYVEDVELINHIRGLMFKDAKPKYPSIIDVKAETTQINT